MQRCCWSCRLERRCQTCKKITKLLSNKIFAPGASLAKSAFSTKSRFGDLINYWMKRMRKQPRKCTPPLSLRDENGEREIIAIDEELVTARACYSGRVTCFLNLGAGLEIRIGSRCVNKRRVTSVTIRPAHSLPQHSVSTAPTYRELLHLVS